jgi:trimeric autotransporter adhesin
MASFQEAYDQLEGVQEPLRSIAAHIVEDSGGAIGISNGFRTREQQQKLYNDYINGVPGQARAARPGHSHHERGLAIDFSGDMDLLAKLGPKYGLQQPMDDEAWHWELGNGQDAQGMEGGGLNFEKAEAENPEDAIANRMNAVLSILGGNGAGGTMEPIDQSSMWGVAQDYEDQMSGIAQDAFAAAGEAGGAALGAAGQIAGGTVGAYQKYAAKVMMQKYGLDQSELPALIELWNRESNWDPNADNPTSSAAGIAQKMTSVHGALENTWQGQIDWGLDYIVGRYGSPSKALAWHDRHNWY